jgi:hypothetical protein
MTISTKTLSATFTSQNNAPITAASTFTIGGQLTGQKVPRWRDKIANGQGATSPMTAFEQELTIELPVRTHNRTTNNPLWWGSSVDERFAGEASASVSASALSLAQAGAVAKFYKQLSSDFKSLTTLGELRESVAMIRGSALRLRSLCDANMRRSMVQRLKARSVSDWRRAASDLWLEYAFGWKPLMSDIKAGYEAFSKSADEPLPQSVAVTYRFNRTEPKALVDSLAVIGTSAMTSQVFISSELEYSCSLKAGFSYTVSNSAANQQFRFGASVPDLVATGWELLPWSFLIDYFVNIGSVLDAYTVASAINVNWCSRTTRVVKTSTITTLTKKNAGADASWKPSVLNEGSATYKRKQISRDIYTPIPPSLRFNTKLSTSQGLNIAALISSQRRDNGYSTRGN